MDGTLIDTDNQMAEKLSGLIRPIFGSRSNKAARKLLYSLETPGNLLITGLDYLSLDEVFISATDWLRRQRGVYAADDFRLIPGVTEMIMGLAKQFKLGIVTTRSRYHIIRFMENFPEIGSVIDVTFGLQDTRRLKPHPEPILRAANQLGVEPFECIMVGDTPVDIKAARSAGAFPVGVLCGFGLREELEDAGAQLVVNETSDLISILGDYLNQ